jgi:hypothetical protein
VNRVLFRFVVLAAVLFFILVGCHSDEDKITPPPAPRETIALIYPKPLDIDVYAGRHWALLLHDRQSPRGTALQLVDLEHHNVIGTRILDYYDAYDALFVSVTEACFVGRTQDTREYAVQFVRLPDLTPTARVGLGDTSGVHGYLALDSAGQALYYSHAGGGTQDGIFKIALGTKTLVDGDDDGHAPFAFDNQLVSGLFASPARIFFDAAFRKIVVANLDDNFITMIDASIWGTVHRGGLNFPITGTSHLSTLAGGLSNARASAMDAGSGIYVMAGMNGNTAFLSRFEANSSIPYPPEVLANRMWRFTNGDIHVHSALTVFSVFLIQQDTSGISIGQYGLNNLRPVAGSPFRVETMPDSAIGAFGLDASLNELVVADTRNPRLEIIPIK